MFFFVFFGFVGCIYTSRYIYVYIYIYINCLKTDSTKASLKDPFFGLAEEDRCCRRRRWLPKVVVVVVVVLCQLQQVNVVGYPNRSISIIS
jgi:hypothetical protein